MQLVNRRTLLIIGGVVVVLIIGVLFALQISRNSSNSNTANDGIDTQVTDQNSGETVSNIEGKTPETFGVLPDVPVYLGLSQFLDVGLTSEQLSNLKYAFYKYAISTNPKITQVSITQDSTVGTSPNADGKALLTFEVMFDKNPKTTGSLVYFDDSIELTLNDTAGKKIFESGTVTGKGIEIEQ